MSIQFAGSKSLDDRRRRRLVVNFDDLDADNAVAEEDPSAGLLSSELVESEAAAPWVPVYEWRIWTYAVILGLLVLAASYAICSPMAFRQELAPVTKHLLQGPRPVLAVVIQTTFWFLSAQLALLIGWYRSRCKIDFRGRYRVWPWVAAVFGMAALCSATDAHELLGHVISGTKLLSWRPEVLSWLLPAFLVGLPLMRLLDRDVRRCRSSLYTLRLAWLMEVVSVCLELFAVDLNSLPWITQTRIILPMVGTATLFVGLWLNARVVAYVCPDPPSADETTNGVRLFAGWTWLLSLIFRPRMTTFPVPDFEADAKPKRGRKKAASDDEETATTKRKRRAPAKRATKPRTRVKLADEEETEEEQSVEDQSVSADGDESGNSSVSYESRVEEAEEESADWNEEPEKEIPDIRSAGNNSSVSNPSAKKTSEPRTGEVEAPASEDEDEEAGDTMLRRDSGLTADQFKGLSKRQKRELRRQSREQQRNQRR